MKSVTLENSNKTAARAGNAVLLIPNLIGYIRILLLIFAVAILYHQPLLSFIAFFLSGNLDMLDGYVARKLKQESRMGAVLDFAIDRTMDVAVFLILALFYPNAWMFFCLILMLDIFSHICQLYSTIFTKVSNHKQVNKEQGFLLHAYYTHRPVLVFACQSYGLWLACFFLYYFYPMNWLVYLSFIFVPGFIFKVIIHLLQIHSVFRVVSKLQQTV